MTEEVQKQEEVQEQQDDAAFEAGFAEARGDESPTPEPVAEETPAEEPVAEEPVTPEPEIVFAGLTEEQLKAALAKAGEVDELKGQVRQLFGRFGEVNSKLQQAASQGQPTKVTPDQLKKLKANFPEFADDLAEDLSSLVLGGGTQQQAFDPSELQATIKAEREAMEKSFELKLLSIKHPDWQTVRSTDDFKLWEQTLPDKERQELNESWDAAYVSTRFDEFKSWREKSQTVKVQKQSRLEAAVTPKGTPATKQSTINDDDAFYAGFKAVRSG